MNVIHIKVALFVKIQECFGVLFNESVSSSYYVGPNHRMSNEK
jgi:hypothetical protein